MKKLNQKLIKQLAAGEIILYNEPKNPEAVRSVLREAFPKDFTHIQGDVSYYYGGKASSGYWLTCDNLARSNKLPVTSISDFLLPENGTITESQTFCGSEKKFEIGKCYEFQAAENCSWNKGKLLGIVDHDFKYIATTGDATIPFSFKFIRPIQPKEIERWINMSQSGNQVGKKCFETEMEARQHAPQSKNVFQVKLTGTYTI